MSELENKTEIIEEIAEPVPTLVTPPVVFLVNDTYQIIFETDINAWAYAEIGGKIYKDSINGVVRSADTFHRVTVPTSVLDDAGEYTVGFSHIADRKAYHPASGPIVTEKRKFHAPGKNGSLKLYMLADTHSKDVASARCASYFGDDLDLLVLCGDIANKAVSLGHIRTVHKIAESVLRGEKPCVFVRGNHDTRGACAELLPSYVGSDCGKTYFTFRVGSVWAVCLDCGEDKIDTHVEYGDIADYSAFRQDQCDFLRKLIKNKACEYEAEGVMHKIAVCHVPFTIIKHDFADNYYDQWTDSLNEIGIDVMLCGHCHRIEYVKPGDDRIPDKARANFPVVIGAKMSDNPPEAAVDPDNEFSGSAFEFLPDGGIVLETTNSKMETINTIKIK